MERAERAERELPDLSGYGTPEVEAGAATDDDNDRWPGPDGDGSGDDGPGGASALDEVEPIPAPRRLRRYLLPGETPIIQQRQHIAVLLEPVLTSLGGLLVAMWLTDAVGDLYTLSGALVLLWLALVARAVWAVWQWSAHWFVVTDRRLIRTWGVITPSIGMLPMRKVTDMLYERPVPGRVLGFGTFVLESAGQDQALREIHFVVDPDETYRRICAELFGRSSDPDDG